MTDKKSFKNQYDRIWKILERWIANFLYWDPWVMDLSILSEDQIKPSLLKKSAMQCDRRKQYTKVKILRSADFRSFWFAELPDSSNRWVSDKSSMCHQHPRKWYDVRTYCTAKIISIIFQAWVKTVRSIFSSVHHAIEHQAYPDGEKNHD